MRNCDVIRLEADKAS